MKRRSAVAPQVDLDVIQQQIVSMTREVALLENQQVIALEANDYTALSDPVPFEVMINHPGIHQAATVEDPVVYYHPGEDDETGNLVPAGFKSVGGLPKMAEWAFAWGNIGASESVPNGERFIGALGGSFTIGTWIEIDISDTSVFTYNDAPYDAFLNYNGAPFRLRKPGRYLLSTHLRLSFAQSFASLFDFNFRVESNAGLIENDYDNPRTTFRPSLWTSTNFPQAMHNYFTLDTSIILADDPFIAPGIVFENSSGSAKTFGQTVDVLLHANYLGQFSNDLVDTDYPL